MQIRQYQIDAFASRAFTGNPAAVCPLADWLDDTVLQAIAEENNLSETAFFVPSVKGFRLRWFTPKTEIDLCGHATLAAAHVLFEHLAYPASTITFETRSGDLLVRRQGPLFQMDFPAQCPQACRAPDLLVKGLGVQPSDVLAAADYLAVFDCEDDVLAISPDDTMLSRLDRRGVIVTAPGRDADFVSRFFAPRFGVPEDPVTGSAHCQLTPYWAKRLGKNTLAAKQRSKRGGELLCEFRNDRVLISGAAVTVMISTLMFSPDLIEGWR